MKKFLGLFLAVAFISVNAFAAVVVQEDGVTKNIAEYINFTTGNDVACTGNACTVANSGDQDLTAGSTFVGLQQQYTTPVTGQYFQLYVYDAQFSPASGAPAGSVKLLRNTANASSCHNSAGGSTFVVCVSDGTNWKSLT